MRSLRVPARAVSLRRGIVAVLVALALVAMIGILSLSLESGAMFDHRRQLQSAAESAAYAGAIELMAQYDVAQGKDLNGLATKSAKEIATGNGFTTGAGSTVQVNIPPKSGSMAGKWGYIEVVIEYPFTRSFSRVLGNQAVTLKARAVASGTYTPTKASVLILESKKRGGLRLDQAGLTVAGDLIVNTKGKKVIDIKKNSHVTAEALLFTGTIDKKNKSALTGDLFQQVPATPNPLAALPAPAKGTKQDPNHYKTTVNGQDYYNLPPGEYDKLEFDSNDHVTLQPGTFYLGDGLRLKNNASMLAENVMIYSEKKDMKFETHGDVRITPPTSGQYAGISLFQGDKKSVKFRNDGNFDVHGTIYAPKGEVRFQKVDMTINAFADDSSFDDWDASSDGDADTVDDGDYSPGPAGGIPGQIIANRLKMDKKSNVTIQGTGIDALKPQVAIIE